MSDFLLTPEFRVSYPAVFEPKYNKLSKENEYSVQALFPKGADLSKLKKAAQAAIEKKWPNPATRPKDLKSPFRNQGDREKVMEDGRKVMPNGYEQDAIYINLKSKQRPGVVDKKVQPIIDPEEFYAGCYAIANISCFAYDNVGKGVSFGLNNLQKTRDGETFSARPKAEDAFAPITEDGDASKASSTNIFGD